MARVPVYQGGVEARALPGQRQQAFDQGDGGARGLQAVGQGLQQFAQARDQYLAKVDEAAAMELDASFGDAVRQVERDFMAAKGRNAIDMADASSKAWNETASSYMAQAKNPRQAAMLKAVMDRRRVRWADQYDRQLMQQTDVWKSEAFESRLGTLAVDAADQPLNSPERAEAFMAIGAVLDERGREAGWDVETRRAKGLAVFSGIHANTVEAMIDAGDAEGAKEYYDANKGLILPGTRNALGGKVQDAYLGFVVDREIRGSFVVDAEPEETVEVGGEKQTVRMIQPVSAEIGSRFGPRPSPGGVGSRNHKGVDYPVPENTPVQVTLPGVVRVKNDPDGYGSYVVVDHGNGLETRYAHLNRVNARDGQRVEQGDVIALSGGRRGAAGAGNSQGAHMHYEVRRNGQAVNPESVSSAEVAPGSGTRGTTMSATTEADARSWAEQRTAALGGDWRMRQALERASIAEINRSRAARADVEGEALRAVEDYLPGGPNEVTSTDAIPRREWNALSPGQRRQISNAIDANNKALAGDENAVDKTAAALTFADLMDEAATNPDYFMARGDFTAEFGSGVITREQFNTLRTTRRNLATGGGEAADQIKNLNGVINAYARQAGITTGATAKPADAERMANLRSALVQSVEGYRQRRKDWPDQNQIIGMLRVLVSQAENEGRSGRLFETGGQIEVSRRERNLIIRELRDAGETDINEDDIQAAARYRRVIGLGG